MIKAWFSLCVLAAASPAWACDPGQLVLGIDVGHSHKAPGATSARGRPEFGFNLALAQRIRAAAQAAGFNAFLVNEDGLITGLAERPAAAVAGGATLFLSVHHDSAQAKYFSDWVVDGKKQRYSDVFAGHSLFYSEINPHPAESLRFAQALGAALAAQGRKPTLHHAEPIPGENRPLVDADLGIYRFDQLGVLRTATIPGVLMEAGVIANRAEEARLATEAERGKLAAAVAVALKSYCAATP